MKKLFIRTIVSTSVLFNLCAFADSTKTWYEKDRGERSIRNGYEEVFDNYSEADIREIFSRGNLYCESRIIKKLSKLDASDKEFAVIKANSLGLIDEVMTDILLQYTSAYEDIPSRIEANSFRIRKGRDLVEKMYRGLFAGSNGPRFCLNNNFKPFVEELNKIAAEDEHQFIFQFLNHYAKRKKIISKEQFKQIEMLRVLHYSPDKLLSIRDYKQKQREFQRLGYDLNTVTTPFHIKEREEDELSLRTNIYMNYSNVVIKGMVAILEKMNVRTNADRSHLVFSKMNDVVIEKVKLSQTEKLRASVKLYKREKKELLSTLYAKGLSFSYREHIALAFELGLINEIDLEFFSSLQTKVKEKTIIQKIVSESKKYGIIATALGGPTAGYLYSLVVSFTDSYVNGNEKRATYKHDLFYGNCGDNL